MNEPQAGKQTSGDAAQSDAIVVQVFGRTDVGLVREHNEDNFLVADLSRGNRSIKPEVRSHAVGAHGSLFVVCDGMGGAAAGEVASRIAVDTIYDEMQAGGAPSNDEELARKLDRAICEAGLRIYTAARLDRGRRGMGTTVTAAVLNSSRLLVGQVGDSRAHIIRDGSLVQITKDQSLVQQLIDAKQLTDDEAKNFERSNIILQALGTAEDVHVDMTQVELRCGDLLVMCSDGLSGMVDHDRILRIALSTDDLVEACRLLTDAACEGGGDDNITVVMARFDGQGLIMPRADDQLAYDKFVMMEDTEDHASKSILTEEDLDDDRSETPRSSPTSVPPPLPAPSPSSAPASVAPPASTSQPSVEVAPAGDSNRSGRGLLVIGAIVAGLFALVIAIWLMRDGASKSPSELGSVPPAVPASAVKPPVVAPAPVEPTPEIEQVPTLSLDDQAFKKAAPAPRKKASDVKKAAPKPQAKDQASEPQPGEADAPGAKATDGSEQVGIEGSGPQLDEAPSEPAPPADSAFEDGPNLILPILPEPPDQDVPEEPPAQNEQPRRKKKPSESPSEPLDHQKLDENPF